MKKKFAKILGVGLAVVLVLSFSGVPVAAEGLTIDSFTGDPDHCLTPLTVDFTNDASGTGTLTYDYYWNYEYKQQEGNTYESYTQFPKLFAGEEKSLDAGPTPTHTFTVPGFYNVKVVVTDDVGSIEFTLQDNTPPSEIRTLGIIPSPIAYDVKGSVQKICVKGMLYNATMPTINGVLDTSEWGSPVFTYTQTNPFGGDVNIYVRNDSDNLYVAAEALGDMSTAQGLGLATSLNVYIDSNNDDLLDANDLLLISKDDAYHRGIGNGNWGAWTAGFIAASGGEIAANGDPWTGVGIVEVRIPLSFLGGITCVDTIGLAFQAFGYDWYPSNAGWFAGRDHPENYADFTLRGIEWWLEAGVELSPGDITDGEAPWVGQVFNPDNHIGDPCIFIKSMRRGDIHIYARVTADPCGEGENVIFHTEKKWGELDHTTLDVDPTVAGVQHTEEVNFPAGTTGLHEEVITDMVYATFLEVPDPVAVGGAVVHWWLFEDTVANQDFIDDLMDYLAAHEGALDDNYWAAHGKYVIDDLDGKQPFDYINDYGAGPDGIAGTADDRFADPAIFDWDFINPTTPGAIVESWYAWNTTEDSFPAEVRGRAQATLTVNIDELEVCVPEKIMIVVLVSYPGGSGWPGTGAEDPFNGENIVCLEKGKKEFHLAKKPKVTEVKTPQVRWAGEKIILEKDWSDVIIAEGRYVAIYHLDEASIGTLYMSGNNYSEELDGGDIWVWVSGADDYVSEVILESQFQGKADVEVALYELDSQVPAYGDPLVNTGFMVYFLAFEDIALAEDISHIDDLTPGVDDAEVAVQVKGWFTCDRLPLAIDPDTGEVRVEKDGRPRGRYVLPDDWAGLAGYNYALRPNWDLMDKADLDTIVSPADLNLDHVEELGPYDIEVVTTTPPGEADDPCIGPFNTLQPWSVDDMWIATNVVPADFMVAAPFTWPRTAADVRNTVVPDGDIDWYDAPMPQALVIFDIVAESEDASLSGLDKGDLEGYGFKLDAALDRVYQSPFYAVEIPSSQLITSMGYNWDSWLIDGPYDYWTDLQLLSIIANTTEVPVDPKDVEVYCDNHGIAGVTIDTLEETGRVTISATAEFPNCLKKGQYPPMTVEIDVPWGLPIEHLDADFEVDPRTGEAPITVTFYGLKDAGTGVPWTQYGTPPYVKAEWDFDGDGHIDETVIGATSALTLATQTFEFEHAGDYSPSLTVTDNSGMVDTCIKPNYIVLTGPEAGIKGDFNNDDVIDFDDFIAFAAAYGSVLGDANYDVIGDFNDDDAIDFDDFIAFAAVYGYGT